MVKKILKSVLIVLLLILLISAKNIYILANAENGDIGTFKVTASSGLRLREYPVNGHILLVMPKNSIINITAWDGKWAFGTYNNVSGWCHSAYIKSANLDNNQTYSNNDNNNNKKLEYFGKLKITGYTSARSENGGYDVTCTGVKLNSVIGECVAVNKKQIPIGTKLYIEGIGYRTAMDTGVRSGVIDVLCSNKSECYSITGYRKVYIVRD